MNDDANDILISAYLDDELSVEERAKVDALLAESADARQALEELKAIRTSLQNLPRYRLGPNFAQSVIERADEQVQSAEPRQPAKNDAPLAGGRVPASIFRSWRGYAWSAIAIAAAAVIMVTTRPPNGPAEKKLARVETTKEAPQDVPVNQPAATSPPKGDIAENERASARRMDDSRPSVGAVASDPAQAQTRFGGLATESGGAASTAAPVTSAAPATPPVHNLAGQVDMGGALEQQKNLSGADFAKTPMSAEPSVAQTPSDFDQQRTDQMLIVRCEVTPEAARRAEFERVLARNKIAFTEQQEETKAGEEQGQARAPDASEIDHLALNVDARGVKDGKKLDSDKFQCIYVEAPAEQLAATIEQLSQAKDAFVSVSASDAPTAATLAALGANNSGITKLQAAAESFTTRKLENHASFAVDGPAPAKAMYKQMGEKDASADAMPGRSAAEGIANESLKDEIKKGAESVVESSSREKVTDKEAEILGRAQRLSNLSLPEFNESSDGKLAERDRVSDEGGRLRGFGGGLGGRAGGANPLGGGGRAPRAEPPATVSAAPAAMAPSESTSGKPGVAEKKAVEEFKGGSFGDRAIHGAVANGQQAAVAVAPPKSAAEPRLQRALFFLREVGAPAAAEPVPAAAAEKR